MLRPALLTLDVFGTILDWRAGLRASLRMRGVSLGAAEFDAILDAQGELERAPPFRSYREITARSLAATGLSQDDADAIGREVGTWPAFADSRPALVRLAARAPIVAMTNSDRDHGLQVRARLGIRFSRWICAEEVGAYKPDPAFWRAVVARTGAALGPAWWHVSAYADYDLGVARSLGLTTVLVRRPHRREGAADVVVPDLVALAEMVDGLWPPEE